MMRFLVVLSLLISAAVVSGFTPSTRTRPSSVLLLAHRPSTQVGLSSSFIKSNKNFVQRKPCGSRVSTCLEMSSDDMGKSTTKSSLPFWLDVGTKGGAVFWSLVLFIVPIIGYNVVTGIFGVDEIEAGKWIGVGFTAFAMLAWGSTYLFRVATKDMTYAKQLKDYENAVIAKRLEELDDDEIQALVEEIERDEF